jgi:hypothetical protein
MLRGRLRFGHLASLRCTGGRHTLLKRSWRLWRTWKRHLMKIWFTLLFQLFKNVQKSVLMPKESIFSLFRSENQNVLCKTKLATPLFLKQVKKSQNVDVFITFFSNHIYQQLWNTLYRRQNTFSSAHKIMAAHKAWCKCALARLLCTVLYKLFSPFHRI